MSDIKICHVDHEPLIWTFEFPGYEYVCVVCDRKYGALHQYAAGSTPERAARRDELQDRYDRETAERTGRPAPPVPPQDNPPTCGGCGRTAGPEDGRLQHDGKPAAWYKRTRDGTAEYACSKSCIPASEMVMPW